MNRNGRTHDASARAIRVERRARTRVRPESLWHRRPACGPHRRDGGATPVLGRTLIRLLVAGTCAIGVPVVAQSPNVAPNAIRRARQRVAPTVVKIYGAGASRVHGYGTGVLVSADGRILTTLSLMTAGRNIRVVLADGRKFQDAKLVRTDDYRQLALLQIDAEDLPFLEPVDSNRVQIGDTVIAFGNWYKVADGDEPMSVTKGILSLKANLNARRLAQPFEYTGPVLIYDAVTSNPGAPGSPVVNIDGELVGLVGRIVEAVNTNTRINYALPSEELAAFLGGETVRAPSLTGGRNPDTGSREEPFVGIKLSKLGFRHVSAYVARVRPGSPAAVAGVRPDDLVLGIDGNRIRSAEDYHAVLAELAVGKTAQFIVKRGEKVLAIDITVGEKPA